MRRSHERGQAMPLLLLVLVLATASALLVAELGVASIEAARAQRAADAAALAGAAAGEGEARAVATENSAQLRSYRDLGGVVQVEVRYRRASAVAAAAALVGPSVPGGDRHDLAPALLAALARADALLGRPVPVVSGFRSRSEQQALWDARDRNPYPVAVPGTSLHEAGLAIDVPVGFVQALAAVAAWTGLCQPLPQTDPVHFEPCPPTRPA